MSSVPGELVDTKGAVIQSCLPVCDMNSLTLEELSFIFYRFGVQHKVKNKFDDSTIQDLNYKFDFRPANFYTSEKLTAVYQAVRQHARESGLVEAYPVGEQFLNVKIKKKCDEYRNHEPGSYYHKAVQKLFASKEVDRAIQLVWIMSDYSERSFLMKQCYFDKETTSDARNSVTVDAAPIDGHQLCVMTSSQSGGIRYGFVPRHTLGTTFEAFFRHKKLGPPISEDQLQRNQEIAEAAIRYAARGGVQMNFKIRALDFFAGRKEGDCTRTVGYTREVFSKANAKVDEFVSKRGNRNLGPKLNSKMAEDIFRTCIMDEQNLDSVRNAIKTHCWDEVAQRDPDTCTRVVGYDKKEISKDIIDDLHHRQSAGEAIPVDLKCSPEKPDPGEEKIEAKAREIFERERFIRVHRGAPAEHYLDYHSDFKKIMAVNDGFVVVEDDSERSRCPLELNAALQSLVDEKEQELKVRNSHEQKLKNPSFAFFVFREHDDEEAFKTAYSRHFLTDRSELKNSKGQKVGLQDVIHELEQQYRNLNRVSDVPAPVLGTRGGRRFAQVQNLPMSIPKPLDEKEREKAMLECKKALDIVPSAPKQSARTTKKNQNPNTAKISTIDQSTTLPTTPADGQTSRPRLVVRIPVSATPTTTVHKPRKQVQAVVEQADSRIPADDQPSSSTAAPTTSTGLKIPVFKIPNMTARTPTPATKKSGAAPGTKSTSTQGAKEAVVATPGAKEDVIVTPGTKKNASTPATKKSVSTPTTKSAPTPSAKEIAAATPGTKNDATPSTKKSSTPGTKTTKKSSKKPKFVPIFPVSSSEVAKTSKKSSHRQFDIKKVLDLQRQLSALFGEEEDPDVVERKMNASVKGYKYDSDESFWERTDDQYPLLGFPQTAWIHEPDDDSPPQPVVRRRKKTWLLDASVSTVLSIRRDHSTSSVITVEGMRKCPKGKAATYSIGTQTDVMVIDPEDVVCFHEMSIPFNLLDMKNPFTYNFKDFWIGYKDLEKSTQAIEINSSFVDPFCEVDPKFFTTWAGEMANEIVHIDGLGLCDIRDHSNEQQQFEHAKFEMTLHEIQERLKEANYAMTQDEIKGMFYLLAAIIATGNGPEKFKAAMEDFFAEIWCSDDSDREEDGDDLSETDSEQQTTPAQPSSSSRGQHRLSRSSHDTPAPKACPIQIPKKGPLKSPQKSKSNASSSGTPESGAGRSSRKSAKSPGVRKR